MRYIKPVLIIAISFISQILLAQQNPPATIEGTWKGTSICQVKNSPCNDEIAIYHVSKSAKENTYTFQMNKIVDGKEVEMGVTAFAYDSKTNILTGETTDRKGNISVWTFKINGNKMTGTLVLYDKQLYRIIKLEKS